MLAIVARTHPGARSGQNQDAVGFDESLQLAFVADGMGGYASGEVASALVKQTLLESLGKPDLESAVLQSHAKIVAAAEETAQYAGMGSTVVALQVTGDHCRVVWVGDSRAYLWRNGSLTPLTRDHSVAEVLRDVENLSETQIRDHPLRHKVIQSLGKDLPTPSAAQLALKNGDRLLLCSDGLSGELRDHEMAELLDGHQSLAEAADALVNGALTRGGHDNISVVLAEYSSPGGLRWHFQLSERAVVWLSLMGGVALAGAVAGIAWWLTRKR
jgi:PPM family protein phosphatase